MRILRYSGSGDVPRAGIFLGVMLAGLLVLAPALRVFAAPAGQPIRIGSTLALTGPRGPPALLHTIAGDVYGEPTERRRADYTIEVEADAHQAICASAAAATCSMRASSFSFGAPSANWSSVA